MMRKFRLFGVLLLALVLFPVRSYAVDFWPNGSYWNGITSPGYYAALVRADDIYGAAAYGLNKDPVSLSSDVRVKLSDPNYGGKFYEYAQTFYNVEGWPNMPEWVPTYVLGTTFGLGQSFERVYASEVTTTLRDEALRDFERVLAGEDLGGGTVVPVGEYYPISLRAMADNEPASSANKDIYRITAQNATYEDGSLVLQSGTTKASPWVNNSAFVSHGIFYVSGDLLDLADSYIEQGFDVGFFVSGSYSSLTGFYSCGIVYGNGLSLDYFVFFPQYNNYYSYGYRGSDLHIVTFSSNTYYNVTAGVFSFVPNFVSSPSPSAVSGSVFRQAWMSDVYSEPFGVVAPPDGTWPEPETPATPTAPEIPTPTAPTDTPDPIPTEPTVVWPTAPIVVNPPEVTVEVTPSGLDYTELLTRINDNLNELNSYVQAINGSLNSLRADIVGGFDDVVTSLRNIYQYLQHLNDILELHCKHLRDALDDGIYNLELYIKSLFEWLPQQLDFDANFDYDDSGIKSYLQRILNKIPGGATGTPQTYMPNPQSDEPGFFDWLLDLWHRFLIDLVSVLPDELGGLVDAFSQLTHYFPFSIPWDLAAFLALFEHEPVTPVFDVPWGFGGDEGEIEMVRVDLSAWDGVMEMVRPVFLVGFCWQLAMITKDLLANFDIKKGGV